MRRALLQIQYCACESAFNFDKPEVLSLMTSRSSGRKRTSLSPLETLWFSLLFKHIVHTDWNHIRLAGLIS